MISAPVSRSLRMGSHTHLRRCNSCLFTGAFVMVGWPSGLRQSFQKLRHACLTGSNPVLTVLVGNALPKCQGSETLQKLITLKIDVT